MQILKRESNTISLLPESLSDLWYLEKIIDPGDVVSSRSTRKFVTETGKSERKKVWVKLEVEKVELHKFSNVLRVLGKIIEGRPEDLVSIGSYHTIDVSPGSSLSIWKERWLSYQLKMVKRAIESSKRPVIALVSIDDSEALVYTLSETGLNRVSDIYCSGSGKMYEGKDVRMKYFHSIVRSIPDVPYIVIGGPGFVKDDFKEFLSNNYPEISKKAIFVDLNSSGLPGINEILSKNKINRVLDEARISRETKLVNELMAEIGKDGMATYGEKNVKEALEFGAVQKLLISEDFFMKNRDRCEELMQIAENTRAEIYVIGSDHDAGKQLKSLGIAAILRFKT